VRRSSYSCLAAACFSCCCWRDSMNGVCECARTPVYKAQRGRAACDTSLRLRGCGRSLFIGGLMKSLTAIVAIAAALTSASASAQVPKEGTLLLPPPDLNRSGASSVRRTVCWMFLCPR
jgi:hypothetical protein